MRNIFIVVSKAFGVFQIYNGLYTTGSILPLITYMRYLINSRHFGESVWTFDFLFAIWSLVWITVVPFVLAWILIFKTEWLANKLRIPESSTPEVISKENVLKVGIILLGLYATLQTAPELASSILQSFREYHVTAMTNYELRDWIMDPLFFTAFVPSLKLLFGLLLMFKVNKIMTWFIKPEPAEEPELPIETLSPEPESGV